METTLTIQGLIRYFEDRLWQIDRQNDNGNGSEPQFPQLVIYLGDDARGAHRSVSADLLQVWPQYEPELKFVWARADGGKMAFSQLFCNSDKEQALTEDGVRDVVSALFGTKMHFSDRSKLLVYYVLDTTGFQGKEELLDWLPRIRAIKELLCANSTDMMDLMFLLLNENMVRQKTAARIRDHLSGFYCGNDVRQTVDSIMMLSNRRDDNAILEDWEVCNKIISAAIALSNNAAPRIVSSVFSHCVMTASYAREEKPLPQIGQVVVCGLIDELGKSIPPCDVKLLDDTQLPGRLGLSKQGTLTILDDYAQSSLFALLPGEDQLEYFPRRDSAFRGRMAAMSAKEFNDYTMGAWEQFLGGIVEKAKVKLAEDSAVRGVWRDSYRARLLSGFSREEILYLSNHLGDVEALMTRPNRPGQDVPVLSAARDQLNYMLSGDRQIIQIFLSVLEELGRAAQDFKDTWTSLLRSMKQLYPVKDKNIITFYGRKVRNFYDRHGSEICREFANMHEVSELSRFLCSSLDRIADSDGIFSCAFEEELESRLNEESLPMDAKQYIREKLTGKEVHTYLQTNFALGEALISAILLKAGTSLHKSLNHNLSPTTTYYDTGSGTTAEALVFYQVSAENLVNGGEM